MARPGRRRQTTSAPTDSTGGQIASGSTRVVFAVPFSGLVDRLLALDPDADPEEADVG